MQMHLLTVCLQLLAWCSLFVLSVNNLNAALANAARLLMAHVKTPTTATDQCNCKRCKIVKHSEYMVML